ncbi:MAG: N-acetyltransferase family protein [Candidatus Binatia bacterium]
MIRAVTTADCDAIARIYNHYVLTTIVSFEEQAVSTAQIAERIAAVQTAGLPWLVAEEDGRVVGYAYASTWHARSGYRFTVESTVYLDANATGRGMGSQLYDALLVAVQQTGAHVVMATIALPNPASVALHGKFGFAKVGHLGEIGFKLERWIDIGYWRRTFER